MRGKNSTCGPRAGKAPRALSLRQLAASFISCHRLEKSPLTSDGHRQKLSRFLEYLELKEEVEITPEVIRQFLIYVGHEYELDKVTVRRCSGKKAIRI